MNHEELQELYSKIRKNLFATLWQLQSTNPHPSIKSRLQVELDVYYDLIGDTLDDDWYPQIEEALK
jgi:hypothetical protein